MSIEEIIAGLPNAEVEAEACRKAFQAYHRGEISHKEFDEFLDQHPDGAGLEWARRDSEAVMFRDAYRQQYREHVTEMAAEFGLTCTAWVEYNGLYDKREKSEIAAPNKLDGGGEIQLRSTA